MSKTYECEVCYGINHVKHLHCSTCGTIPKAYSPIGKPCRLIETQEYTRYIEVTPAIECSRTERYTYARVYLRTVPADYYAGE